MKSPVRRLSGRARARLLLGLAAVVAAACGRGALALSTCPTDAEDRICSSHGSCGSDSTCTCFANWDYAADCSQRTCPSGTAWFDKATSDNVAHASAECSNAGNCNRATGECDCFDGFEGNACQRTACDCSGHGYCKSIADLASAHAGVTYTNWEAATLQMCYCDDGYTGYDCSLRMCPKGDDYKTTGQTYRQVELNVHPADPGADTLGGTVTLHFGKYKVTFDGNQDSVDCDADIIDQLGNVNMATCVTSSGSGGGASYLIELQSFPSQPRQNNLFYHDGDVTGDDFYCDVSRLETDGAEPGVCNVTTVNPDDDVYEYAYCGNSGVCDFSEGVCSCFDGFTGVACGSLLEVIATGASDPVLALEAKSLAYTGDLLELSSYKSGSSDFNFVTATDGDDVVVLAVDGTGAITAAGALAAPSVAANGVAISDGGLAVSDSATMLASSHSSAAPLSVNATSAVFAGDVASLTGMNAGSPETFNFLAAYDSAGASKFSLRGDGLLTATDINVDYLTVLAELSVDTDLDVSGDGAMRSLALVEDASASNTVLDVSSTVSGYTGTLVSVGTTEENTASVTLMQLSNSDGTVLDVAGDGMVTVHSGGLLVDAGGLEVSAGGLVVDSGGATVDGGFAVLDGGTQLNASSGVALAVHGLASVRSELASTSPLTVSATSGSFSSTAVLKLEHELAASADDVDFVRGVAAGTTVFAIDGEGSLQTDGDVRGTTLGMQAQADGDRPLCTAANRGDFYLNTDTTDDLLYICMLVSGSATWREVTTTAI